MTEKGDQRGGSTTPGADAETEEEERRDATPTVPILIPREYEEAHRRDSEPPTALDADELARLEIPATLPGPPSLPAGVAASADRAPAAPPPVPTAVAARSSSASDGDPVDPPGVPEPAGATSVSSIAPTETRPRPSRRAEPAPDRGRKWPLLLLAAGLIGLLALGLRQTAQPPPEPAAAAATVANPAPSPIPEPVLDSAPMPAPEPTPEPEPEPESETETATAEAPAPVQVAVAEADPAPAPAPAEAAPAPRPRKKRLAGVRKPRKARKPATAPEPAQGPLPETPARAAVKTAMSSIQAAAAACTQGQHGVAELQMTLSSDGRVRHAEVGGYFHGTPVGSCIAREVRKARVPPFQQPKYRVFYPLSL
jgi:hypothetical protein